VSLVLDTSMSLAWCFLDERPESAVAVLNQVTDTGALVPALWHLEIANALQAAVRRGRISTAFRDETLSDLAALPITVDNETDRHAWRGTLGLAERFDLTLYDAAYLELAHRTRLPLASLDVPLWKAAEAVGVRVIGGRAQ
jgi:predicted nucleic acid-binding protein